MFLIDDILLAPAHGILAIFREIHKAAQQEFENEGEAIRAELSELYMMLETNQVTEADFEKRETELLDRLDKLQEQRPTEAEGTFEEEADSDTNSQASGDSAVAVDAGEENEAEMVNAGAGIEGE